MLALRKLIVTHFKNYSFNQFDFKSNVVGICGLNGMGKTNLLDAIYYCCFTKSYFAPTDQLNIQFGKEGFRVEAQFTNAGTVQKVVCIHRGQSKKEFFLNEVPYEKFSKHIGLIPAVMISPDDTVIISGSSENRRRYLDNLLCQLDNDYLEQLVLYNKVLLQRNALLKQFAESRQFDTALLEIIDQQLAAPAQQLYEKRVYFTGSLIPLVNKFYKLIAPGMEQVTVRYESHLHDTGMLQLLQASRDKDRFAQRTQAGVHKDDLVFETNQQLFRHIASQGQRKSLLFALKLAAYEMIRTEKGFPPLLLLDDVFEKLDDMRMRNLLQWVCLENKGQVFITDTHRDRLEQVFKALDVEGEVLEL